MDINTSIKKELLDDEVIQYIARRYHVTADDVVDSVIAGDCIRSVSKIMRRISFVT